MNMFLGMKIVARILYSFFLEVGFFDGIFHCLLALLS